MREPTTTDVALTCELKLTAMYKVFEGTELGREILMASELMRRTYTVDRMAMPGTSLDAMNALSAAIRATNRSRHRLRSSARTDLITMHNDFSNAPFDGEA